MSDYEMRFTAAGLPDPVPAGHLAPLPAGVWVLAMVELSALVLETFALVNGQPFWVFGRGWTSALTHLVFAPMAAWAVARRTARLRSSAYIFFSLAAVRALKATFVGGSYSLEVSQGVLLLAVCVGGVVYLQTPAVLRAVPRLKSSEMKNRLMQRFQRTLNG